MTTATQPRSRRAGTVPDLDAVDAAVPADADPDGPTAASDPGKAGVDGEGDRIVGAQVVDRVVDILETFATIGPELGVSDVSRALGLKKATAHRLLASLLRRGLVAQDPVTRRYRLGMKLWELGSLATSQLDWVDRVKPFLQHLTDVSGETSHLAVLNDGQVLYVDKVESSRSLRMPSQVGKRLPVHCTGVGKALIAFLPEEVLRGVLSRRGMPRMTAHTITDRDVLLRRAGAGPRARLCHGPRGDRRGPDLRGRRRSRSHEPRRGGRSASPARPRDCGPS